MLEGKMDSTMAEKAENDAAAQYPRPRPAPQPQRDWAERSVRESASITADVARDSNVINFIAENVADLLDSLDGRTTTLPRGKSR